MHVALFKLVNLILAPLMSFIKIPLVQSDYVKEMLILHGIVVNFVDAVEGNP